MTIEDDPAAIEAVTRFRQAMASAGLALVPTATLKLLKDEYKDLAIRLAMALADEVTFHGDEDSAEASKQVLHEAAETLNLYETFEQLDSLKPLSEHRPM